MAIIDEMIQEFRREAGSTRKLLERLPDGDWDWKPHEKSFTLGRLASHLAEVLGWVPVTMKQDEFVVDMATYRPFAGSNREEVLRAFDQCAEEAVSAMEGTPDEAMARTWTMKVGERVALRMPRAAVVRAFILSHLIHHRAQLGVYLRMRDVAVPSVYGPSADEAGPMGPV